MRLTDIDGVAPYLSRINAEPRGLFAAVIQTRNGHYWTDKATVRFAPDGMVKASEAHQPTEQEQAAIKAGFAKAKLPEYRTLDRLPDRGERVIGSLPDRLQTARNEDRLFIFHGRKGEVLMLQERVEQDGGEKAYLPWTFWNDDKWRMAEGPDRMPLYGIQETDRFGIVWLHEGAKAARAMQRLREDPRALAAHPWGEDLEHVGHLAWCTGAPSPGRTDWKPLRNVERLTIVADNDELGLAAVPKIARHLKGVVWQVQFPKSFPAGFDMADPWPDGFGKLRFRECLHPATWATDLIPSDKKGGRSRVEVRQAFAGQFAHIATDDVFVHLDLGQEYKGRQAFNSSFRNFADAANIADPFLARPRRMFYSLGYRPGGGETIYPAGKAALNRWTAADLEPVDKPATPFLEFLAHLIPAEKERADLLRWLRTLACKVETRMSWSCLLIGDFGVGKSTLGWIAAHLVGQQNASFPSEKSLVSSFNEWTAYKRLAVIHEVHVTGHSRAVYQSLKSAITDDRLAVNRKYREEVTLENHLHVLACSNSLLALRLGKGDRRWFVPSLNDAHWGEANFRKLYVWLKAGPGLGAILHYLQTSDGLGWVEEGQHAPRTDLKATVEEESISDAERAVMDLAEGLAEYGKPACVLGNDMTVWLLNQRLHRPDGRILRKIFEQRCEVWPRKVQIGGRRERFVALNEAGWAEAIENKGDLTGLIVQPEALGII